MTAKSAELKLKESSLGDCYLLRYSESANMYKLSVKHKKGTIFQHFRIKIINNHAEREYEIEGTKKKFDDFSELLDYYEMNPVNRKIFAIGKPIQGEVDQGKKTKQKSKLCCIL